MEGEREEDEGRKWWKERVQLREEGRNPPYHLKCVVSVVAASFMNMNRCTCENCLLASVLNT